MSTILKLSPLLLFFLFCSCNKQSNNLYSNKDLHIIDLDHGEKKDTLYLSTLFKGVKCIPLETTENSLLGRISKILVYRNHIYVLDKIQARGLFVFDMNGRFIRKIGNRGSGPSEYNQLHDFTINTDNEEIIIVADYKILFFEILTGLYKTTVALQNFNGVSSIQYFDNMLYADLKEHQKTSDDCLMQSINLSTGKQEGKFLKSNEYNKGINEFITNEVPDFIPSTKPPFLFRSLFMDTFFSLTPQGVYPYLTVKSNFFVNKKDFDSFEKIYPDFIHGTNKIYALFSYFNQNDYIHLKFRRMINDKNNEHSVLYNTKSRTIQIFNITRNDLLYKRHGRGIAFKSIFFDELGVYECINSFLMSTFLKIVENNEFNDSIKDQLKGLNQESNPVIFYYEFK